MTQIKKAFYAAVQNTARENFQTIFRKALKEKAEQYCINEMGKISLLPLNAQNLPYLIPQKALSKFIILIEDMLNTTSQEAYRQAIQVTCDNGFGKYTVKGLETMNYDSVMDTQKKVIAQWLDSDGLPAAIYAVGIRLFKQFYAAIFFQKLNAAYKENADEDFISLVERLEAESTHEAFLTMADYNSPVSAPIYQSYILPQLLYDLKKLRDRQGDKNILRNEQECVVNAFFLNR